VPWQVEPQTGVRVWVDPNTGKAQLRDKRGNVVEQDMEHVGATLLSRNYFAASPEDVKADDAAHAPLAERLQTGAEAAGAHAVDLAATGLQAAEASPAGWAARKAAEALTGKQVPLVAGELSGRKTLAGAAGIVEHARGGEALAAEREFDQEMRAQEEAHPWITGGAQLGVDVLATVGMGGLGAARTLGGKIVVGAAEGAFYGAAQAPETAWVRDEELTTETTLASMGVAAVLGGGIAGALGLGGKLFQRVRPGRYATGIDGPAMTARQMDDAAQTTAESILGRKAPPGFGAKLREVLEAGREKYVAWKGAASGLSAEQQAMFREANPFTATENAMRLRALERNRDELVERGSREMIDAGDSFMKATEPITREVVDPALKRSAVARNLADLTPEQRQAAIYSAVDAAAEQRRVVAELAAESRGGAPLTRGGNVAGYEATAGSKQIHKLNRHLSELETVANYAAAKGDAAGVYMANDKGKRAVQNYVDNLNATVGRVTDPEKLAVIRRELPALRSAQEPVRLNLADENFWGKQGAAQAETNQRWERLLRVKRKFHQAFTERGERDWDTGIVDYAIDNGRVVRFMKGLGSIEQEKTEHVMREYVDSMLELGESIGRGYDLRPDQLTALQTLRDSARTMKRAMEWTQEDVIEANLLHEVIQKTSGSGILGTGTGALGGAVAGGPLGALVGGAAGTVADAGRMWRVVNALEANDVHLGTKIKTSVSSFLERSQQYARIGKRGATEAVEETGEKAARRAAKLAKQAEAGETDRGRRLATRLVQNGFRNKGETKQEAYERRVNELTDIRADPERVAANINRSLGDVQAVAPNLSAAIALRATQNASYLLDRIPAGTLNLRSYTPHLAGPSVTDREIDKFGEMWSGVQAPLSILDDLRDGSLTREKVEAVKMTYPRIFAEIQARVLQGLAEMKHPLSYRARVQLDLLLDLNGQAEPSLSPAFLARGGEIDARRRAEMQQAQQQAQSRPTSGKLAAAYATQGQALAGMRST
jgi:hypothetical protein